MNILIAGASGLIGRRLATELRLRGHMLTYVVRSTQELEQMRKAGERCVCMDFAVVPDKHAWLPALQNIDVAINAVGIFKESGTQSFEAIHKRAPIEFFRACAAANVAYVIQLSALGADTEARSAYHLSKRAADDYLRGLPLNAAIIQPSLVYAPEGQSSQFFLMLASMPLLFLPGGGQQEIQPVHVQDVVVGIANLVEQEATGIQTLAFTGARPVTLQGYLALLRHGMGLGRQLVMAVPMGLARLFASFMSRFLKSFIDPESLEMLERGNTAPNTSFAEVLGYSPQDPADFIPAADAGAALRKSLLNWGMPALRYSLAVVWIWTGIVSLWLYPVEMSYALLAQTGLTGERASLALYGAGALDLVLGIATLALARRFRPQLWLAQFVLISIYTLIISVQLPEFWLHPYGPVLKNLPMLAALLVLWTFDSRREGR